MSIWATPEPLDASGTAFSPYVFEQLRRSDIPELVARLSIWCPDIRFGALRHYLDPAFYESDSTLFGEGDCPLFVYVGRHEGEMVYVASLRVDDGAHVLVGEFTALSPGHRQEDFAAFWSYAANAHAVAVGAAVILTYVPVRNLQGQLDAELSGFSPVGIIPCSDRALTRLGIRHVSDVLYARVLACDDAVECPDEKLMTPAVRRLRAATRFGF